MAIYYISDLHFNHARIIELCDRPYNNVKEMNEDMIKKWNSVVTDKDTVYFLGDAGLPRNVADQKAIAELMKKLNGKKHLLQGNHDHKLVKDTYFRKIFESISEYKRISDDGRTVILSHYPFEDWDGKFRGSFHIHGHIHNNKEAVKTVIPNRINVSAEVINYTPMTLDQLLNNTPIKVKIACDYNDKETIDILTDLAFDYKNVNESVVTNLVRNKLCEDLCVIETNIPTYKLLEFYEKADSLGAIRG